MFSRDPWDEGLAFREVLLEDGRTFGRLGLVGGLYVTGGMLFNGIVGHQPSPHLLFWFRL
jgi:hypothetical protein